MLRYIKRFTGTKKNPNYTVVLQQWHEHYYLSGEGAWVDLTPDTATWETVKDLQKFETARKFQEEHEFR